MIDWKKPLVSILETVGLPVYYELICDSSIKTPCITYIENDNSSVVEGDTLCYSRLSFLIKIWGTDLAILSQYADKLDDVMRQAGFVRQYKNELVYNNTQIQFIFRFDADALENL